MRCTIKHSDSYECLRFLTTVLRPADCNSLPALNSVSSLPSPQTWFRVTFGSFPPPKGRRCEDTEDIKTSMRQSNVRRFPKMPLVSVKCFQHLLENVSDGYVLPQKGPVSSKGTRISSDRYATFLFFELRSDTL